MVMGGYGVITIVRILSWMMVVKVLEGNRLKARRHSSVTFSWRLG